jgi:diacylglycerol kinase (ATP)
MVILLNPHAGGGTAGEKWSKIESEIRQECGNIELYKLDGSSTLPRIKQYLEDGCREFVAAGGDGTVNMLIEDLIAASNGSISKIKVGAIGLGSSNDFHKPKENGRAIGGVPCRMDFQRATKRDLGCITYEDAAKRKVVRHFILNSSVGITAEANSAFNRPDPVLAFLKERNTNAAIMYAALKTILLYRNKRMRIEIDGQPERELQLTNLGVVKNPHFSGDFCYDSEYLPANGRFNVHICENMSLARTLLTLYRLSQSKFSRYPKCFSTSAPGLKVESDEPFSVEFDGEVIETTQAEFSIWEKALEVCP